MQIPVRSGEQVEVPQEWIDEWNKVYYDVPRTLADIRMWCLDNADKRKTKRGLRAFLGRWIRKSCIKRPAPSMEGSRPAEVHTETMELVSSLETRKAHLAKLKELVK